MQQCSLDYATIRNAKKQSKMMFVGNNVQKFNE